jgi:general secretion pathway protein I
LRRQCDENEGFTLLEAVVAFTVTAMSMIAIFELLSKNLQGTSSAESYVRANLLAESRLESMGRSERLIPGTVEGRIDDRYGWQTVVTPVAVTAGEKSADSALGLKRVRVTVFWDEGKKHRELSLESLRAEVRQ